MSRDIQTLLETYTATVTLQGDYSGDPSTNFEVALGDYNTPGAFLTPTSVTMNGTTSVTLSARIGHNLAFDPIAGTYWLWGRDSENPDVTLIRGPERLTVITTEGHDIPNALDFVQTVNGQGPDAAGNVVVSGGGGGAVASVNSKTGAVVLSASDVGADASGAAAAVTAASINAVPTSRQVAGHALSADVTLVKGDVGLGNVDNTSDASKPVSTAQATALAAKLTAASNLSDLASAATARTNLGLGTAATQPSTAFLTPAQGNSNYAPIADVVNIVDNGDGTADISGPGIVVNGDGTVSIGGTAKLPRILAPSGDTTGVADTAAINTAANTAGHVLLGAGQWYVKDVGLTTSNVWLQGTGNATVLNVIATHTGIVVTGPGNLTVSDMSFSGGAYGIVVNGAYDAIFRNLNFTGQTSGGVKINGDDATEQHWTDVVMRGVGGVAFDLERTTTIYTGSLYMDRVRIVEPAAGATGGFRFNSTAGSASLNIAFMTQCVADNYAGEALYVNNCAQVFVSESWFAINASAPSGSAAMHITGGFQQSYNGCYTYSGRTDPSVKLDGSAKGISIGGGHTFDGTPTTVALGLAGVATGGLKLGDYLTYCGGGLTDTPLALQPNQPVLPGYNGHAGEETFSRLFCNSTPALASGTLFLTFFTAAKTEVISTVECMVNNAASGVTYAGMGLYTVDASGNLALVAKGEATTLFTSAFQPVGGFNTKIGFASPATYTKQAGQRYAVGVLMVGTTPPNLIGANASSGTPQSNLGVTGTPLGPLSAQKSGQSTLGTVGTQTHTAASLSGFGGVPYFVLA